MALFVEPARPLLVIAAPPAWAGPGDAIWFGRSRGRSTGPVAPPIAANQPFWLAPGPTAAGRKGEPTSWTSSVLASFRELQTEALLTASGFHHMAPNPLDRRRVGSERVRLCLRRPGR